MDVDAPDCQVEWVADAVEGEWTVVAGRRHPVTRQKAQRPAYVPRQCDQCHLDHEFPSRTAYRNHLSGRTACICPVQVGTST